MKNVKLFLSRSSMVLLGILILGQAIASEDLLSAAEANNTAVVMELINNGASVNVSSSDGTTALHWAAYHDNLVVLERLVSAEADVNARNEFGSSPMYEAAVNGNTQMLKALLDAGADVESANLDGQTTLMTIVRGGNTEAAELLITRGANVNQQETWQGQTALMWAAARMQPQMVRVLLEHGADPDIVSKVHVWGRRVTAEPRPQRRPPGGWTALAYAARQGCAECIRELANAGADLDLVSPEGISPLLMATINGRHNAARALIEAGADVNRWDMWGRAPLYSVIDFKTIPTGGRADRPSLDETTPLQVINMLLERGANPNMQLKLFPPYRDLGEDRGADSMLGIGATPLIRAAKAGDIESVQALLEFGALPNLANQQRMTPLIIASGEGSGVVDVRARYMNEAKNIEVARLLLQAGADINARRDNGHSALHGAAGKGWNDFIRFLVENGADLDIEDNFGLTPYDTAMGRVGRGGFFRRQPEVHLDTAALLLELGATETAPPELDTE